MYLNCCEDVLSEHTRKHTDDAPASLDDAAQAMRNRDLICFDRINRFLIIQHGHHTSQRQFSVTSADPESEMSESARQQRWKYRLIRLNNDEVVSNFVDSMLQEVTFPGRKLIRAVAALPEGFPHSVT